MNHGIQKWTNFQELSAVFPDPLGVGSPLSLGLAIFGELACSMAFIIGFLYRLAMIPMVFTMAVAFFVIHGNDPFATKELAFVYLVVFILMYIILPEYVKNHLQGLLRQYQHCSSLHHSSLSYMVQDKPESIREPMIRILHESKSSPNAWAHRLPA